MKILFGLFLLFLSLHSPAQILKNLKDKAISNVKNKARTEVKNSVSDEVRNYRAQFDSTDFDYALLLSDNSGLFSLKKKGEFGNKFLQLRTISTSLKDAELSDAENASLNLEMGQAAFASEKFVFAEKRFITAKKYFEKAYLTNDFGYMKTIANQGLLYTTMGRFAQAEKATADALNMRQNKLGGNNMAVAASLNNYGVLHYNLGQYNESEKDFEAAIGVIKTNNQLAAMPYSIVLNNQAMLYQSIGRYEEAVKVLKESIAIVANIENNKTKNQSLFLSNLALLYQQMGQYDEAEKIYQGLAKRFDKTKPEYANLLNNFATLYLLMDKQDKVEDMLKQSAAIFKSSLGDNSPAYAKVISDLGNFYRYKARYDEAETILQQALHIREQSLNLNHPLYVQSQEDLAILYWKKKDFEKAYPLYHEVMEKTLDFINRYFGPMSEAEKTKYWDMLSPRFQRFYNFAVEAEPVNKNSITDLFEYRVATKGLLISSTRKVSQSILGSGNEQLINDYMAWIDSKEELTRLYVYSKEELKEQSVNLDSLEAATNAMEKRLSESSQEFSQFYFAAKINFTEIQEKLKPDEALVEIIRLRNFDQILTNQSKYIGLVVTKNNPQPKLVILENGLDMENKFSKTYRLSMRNKINDEQSYDHYWAPFETETKGKKTIYVSLDGVYNQINLCTLKKPGADFLIKQYDIVLLGNAKDLLTVNNKKNTSPGKKATLIGFPIYNSAQIPELPATKTEVDGINKVLRSSGYQVAEFIQKDATESNLKSAKKVSVLHIATHGYFLQDVEKASWPIGVSADNAKDNVLLRSGLLLTGASVSDSLTVSLDSTSNGTITSYEAMNLDLSGTSLVVLSACETGLGEVKAGEGVYGLQRAFIVAGAESLVMSLWKVDDAATQQLMNSFYANWLKTGDRQKSFKQAQLDLMTKFKDPYFWGAFVMMED